MIMIWGLLIIFLASFVQGVTGFGFALIAVPLLSKIIPLQMVVPIVVLFSFFSNIMILLRVKPYIDLRKMKLLLFSSLIAAPLGTYLLMVVSSNVLKIIIGLIIIVFAFLLIKGYKFPIRNVSMGIIPVGFASGLLNGSISFSGPPVVLFLSNQGVEKNGFRANLTAYAFILNIVTIGSYLLGGLINKEVIHYTCWFIFAMILGVLLGDRVVNKINESQFRKITLLLIIFSGAWTVVSVIYK
ncbi:sulfite exporter TauE/SafE family protein [Paenibacillus sp. P25]|nr:sulfite exporter TauE/SafE family protein [Paenibacillus sp. P25]